MKFEGIKNFIKRVDNNDSPIKKVYLDNFRELLKLIPYLGSIIDSNVFVKIKDEILSERLENIESSCKKALNQTDESKLLDEIKNINNIIFTIFLTNDTLVHGQKEIKTHLEKIIEILGETKSPDFNPEKGFQFITLSGPSAVGKDCMLDLIDDQSILSKNQEIEILTKFTTRPKRDHYESKYYNFIGEKEFNNLVKSQSIIFPYLKRGYKYGFDRNHLFSASQKSVKLFAIFTHFESFVADFQYIINLDVTHTSILLEADEKTLKMRTKERLIPEKDKAERLKSIKKDLDFIEENKTIIRDYFDIILDNNDFHAKNPTFNNLVEKIGLEELKISY